MGRPLHNPPIAGAAWPTLLARPGHLFLALIITILSALPAAAQNDSDRPDVSNVVIVNNYIIPTGHAIGINELADRGIISGIDNLWNYRFTSSSDTSIIDIQEAGQAIDSYQGQIGSAVVTLTHVTYSDISFKFNITVKLNANDFVSEYMSERGLYLYVNQPVSIEIPNDYVPLAFYDSIKSEPFGNDSGVIKVTVEDNILTLTGKTKGNCSLFFLKNGGGSGFSIDVYDMPVPIADNIIIPTGSIFNMYDIFSEIGMGNWIPTSSDSNLLKIEETGNLPSFHANNETTGSVLLTLTNQSYPNVKSVANVTVKKGIHNYVRNELENKQKIYIGETTSIVIPEGEYMALSDYTSIELFETDNNNGSLSIGIEGNKLNLTGVKEGTCNIIIKNKVNYDIIWSIPITKKPSKEDIVVNDSIIVVPSNSWIYLNQLIEDKVVEGVFGRGDNYAITSSNSDVRCDDDGSFIFWSAGSSKITFTHKEFPDVTFDLDVTAKLHPFNYIEKNLGTVYVDDSKDITIPDEYLPLDDFLDIKKADQPFDEGSTADFEFSRSGNNLTIKGISEGRRLLEFHHKFGTNLAATITIAKKPSSEDIVINDSIITVPTGSDIRLSTLIESGVVSGVNSSDSDWLITSSNPDFYVDNDYNYIYINKPGTSTITYTHKHFKEVSFSIEVIAKLSPTVFIQQNLGTVYINDSREITIPDEYIPLSEFTTIQRADWTWDNHPNADFKVEHEGNTLFITGLGEGERMLEFIHKYGSNIGAIITIAKKPSNEDIVVNDSIITIPTGTVVYFSTMVASGVVSGIAGSNDNWIITSSNPDFYVGTDGSYFRTDNIGTSTITFTNKDFKDICFSIEVIAKLSPADYIQHNLGTVYLNEPKPITIPEDYIPLDEFTNIDKADWTWENYPNADFKVWHEGNNMYFTGLGEGMRILYLDHKYGTNSATITIAKRPSADDIKTSGSGVVIPTRIGLGLRTMITDGWVTGIDANQVNDFILTSSDNNIFWPYDNSSNGFARGNKTGEVTLTFTHKELPDVKFDFMVNVKKGPAESIINQMGNPYVGMPYTITLDSELPLSDYEFKLLNDKGEENSDLVLTLDGNNLTVLGNAPMGCRLSYTYIPTNIQSWHGFSIVEAPANTPVVDEDGNGQSQTSIETPVKITLPAEIAEKAEGKTVIWKSDNEVVATVDENGLVHPVKVGKTVITASVEDVTSRAGATTLMSIEFWVTDVEISVPSTLKVGETAKATYRVVPEDCPNKPDDLWWRAYNSAVVAIGSDGNITAVGPGSTEVALIVGTGKKFAIITVVGDDEPEVTEINLDTEKISGVEGTTYHLEADVDDLTWSSSDESVAVVDQNGIVTLVGAGRAIITATAPNGVKATCEVVVEAASGINGVEADTEAAFAPVYDLTGRLVARTPEQMAALRAGIYIQAGRKIYISK